MQVANNARAIESYLEKRYEKAIESVQRAADTEADELSASYEKQARKLEADILAAAKTAAQNKRVQEVSAAKTQARRDEESALGELADEVIDLLRNQYLKSKKKADHLKEIRSRVQQAIKDRGLDVKDFEFEEDESSLRVQAQTDDLLIEDGLEMRLEDYRTKVIEHVKKQVRP